MGAYNYIMNNTTFIEKYKPYYISDFFAEDRFYNVLRTLLKIDNLNVLFVGSAGSGKTTLLYALIREYYGLSKGSPFPENNIMYINNLKEQGINYYRNEMKTFCRSSSNIFGKKKLIIVDDLDTINEQSQQVFRNYIDKYQNNVNFISVCTSIQKVIESIQSRLHIIKLEQLSQTHFHSIMNKIIDAENIVIDEESKDYLLKISKNSIRSLINYLERIHIYGEPSNIYICKKLCSHISFDRFEEIIQYIREEKLSEAMQVFFDIHDYGYSVIDILDYFFNYIKQTKLLTEDEKYKTIPIICKYITIFHNVHEDAIELALFLNNLCNVLKN
jgi:DNA polymerase III delta prime subunit